jgi:hypothetical protein
LAVLATAACSSGLDETALARRAADSMPRWETYQEDIKAQVGARPVAEWSGAVEEVRVEPPRVVAAFRLSGPWAQRDAAVPVLMQGPLTEARRHARVIREGDRIVYEFDVPELGSAQALPWIELKYPRQERRIALSPEGTWHAEK